MNFHISPLSPLRPQFSSSSLGAPRNQPSVNPNHTGSVTIEVDRVESDDDDDDDDLVNHSISHGGDVDTDSESDISADDVTQDSRDVLVQRLTDLVDKLSEANVRTSSIEALHKHVDEMERVLRGSRRDRSTSRHSTTSSSRRQRRGSSLRPTISRPRSLQLPPAGGGGGGGGSDLSPPSRDTLGMMTAPLSPSWFMSHFQRRPSVVHHNNNNNNNNNNKEEPEEKGPGLNQSKAQEASSPARLPLDSNPAPPPTTITISQPPRPLIEQPLQPIHTTTADSHPSPEIASEVTETFVKEAEKLCAEMATVIESLQSRREESDVIPSLLFLKTLFITQSSPLLSPSLLYILFQIFTRAL